MQNTSSMKNYSKRITKYYIKDFLQISFKLSPCSMSWHARKFQLNNRSKPFSYRRRIVHLKNTTVNACTAQRILLAAIGECWDGFLIFRFFFFFFDNSRHTGAWIFLGICRQLLPPLEWFPSSSQTFRRRKHVSA